MTATVGNATLSVSFVGINGTVFYSASIPREAPLPVSA